MYQSQWRFSKSTDYLRRNPSCKVTEYGKSSGTVFFIWKPRKTFRTILNDGRWISNGREVLARSAMPIETRSSWPRVSTSPMALRTSAALSATELDTSRKYLYEFLVEYPNARETSASSANRLFTWFDFPFLWLAILLWSLFWYTKIFIYSARLGIR